jgi:hypothetical protein
MIDLPAMSFKPGEPISELLSWAAVSEALDRHRADLSVNTYRRNEFPMAGAVRVVHRRAALAQALDSLRHNMIQVAGGVCHQQFLSREKERSEPSPKAYFFQFFF